MKDGKYLRVEVDPELSVAPQIVYYLPDAPAITSDVQGDFFVIRTKGDDPRVLALYHPASVLVSLVHVVGDEEIEDGDGEG